MEMLMTRIVSLKKVRQATEAQEQIKFVNWLRKQGFRPHHSPNGGHRNVLEAIKFKRMGTSSGFPDVFVPFPSGNFHGFFCEMKSLNGKVSESQNDWIMYLKEQGYFAVVANSNEAAQAHFMDYIRQTPKAA